MSTFIKTNKNVGATFSVNTSPGTFSASNNSNLSIGITGTATPSTTLTISGTATVGTVFTINQPIIKLHVLGEDFEMEGVLYDTILQHIIATLNVLGEPYWRELKKQDNMTFNNELEKFIELRLKHQRRNNNIDKIIGDE